MRSVKVMLLGIGLILVVLRTAALCTAPPSSIEANSPLVSTYT